MNQMKLSDLRKYAEAHSSITDDLDKPYVTHFEVSDDKKHWLIVWTTKRLVKAQITHQPVNHLQLDATYKLLYQGFPYYVSSLHQ